MDTRIISRLAYDGNYERAIQMLLDVVEKQDKIIRKLVDCVAELNADKNTVIL